MSASTRVCGCLLLAMLTATPILGDAPRVISVPRPIDASATALLQQAQRLVRAALEETAAEQQPIEIRVELAPGVYRLEAPLQFGPEDVGDERTTVVWRAADPEKPPLLSAGQWIDGWREVAPGLVRATVPGQGADRHFRAVWVNGHPAPRSREPDAGPLFVAQPGPDRRTFFTWKPNDEWADVMKRAATLGEQPLAADNLEVRYRHIWSISLVPVATIDGTARELSVTTRIGGAFPFFEIAPHHGFWLENDAALCDQPGEWWIDHNTGELTYRLRDGEDPASLEVVVPKLRHVLHIAGREDRPVRGLRFENLRFAHAAAEPENENTYLGIQAYCFDEPANQSNPELLRDARMRNYQPAYDPQFNLRRVAPPPGGVWLTYARDCRLTNIHVENMEGSGISFGRGCHDCRLIASTVADCGANGVQIGEADPYATTRGAEPTVKTVVMNTSVERCRVLRCGGVYWGAVGIWGGITEGTRIVRCEVADMPYTGISVGWRWRPDPTGACRQTIARNHVHHCMLKVFDGSGIYVLGSQPDSRIAANLIHDVAHADSRYAIYLDQGSRGWTIANNFGYNLDRFGIHLHQTADVAIDGNTMLVPEGGSLIRFSVTPEETIRVGDNRTNVEDREAAIRAWRERIGEPVGP